MQAAAMFGKTVAWVLCFALWLTQVVAGLTVLTGAVMLGMFGPVAYMLWAGHVQPGDRLFMDGVTPTNAQAAAELLLGCGFIVLGMWLGRWARKPRGANHLRPETTTHLGHPTC
jgi:hypothetical protein